MTLPAAPLDAAVPLLEARGVAKTFGSVRALGGVDLTLHAGRVHCLFGENGAGKSTLLHVLSGLVRPDAGTLALGGAPCPFPSPRQALERGIGMVHQHFMLVGSLTALENAMLGAEPVRGGPVGALNRAAARAELVELAERFGFALPLDEPAERLSVGERQRLEILRVLQRRPRILLLDEPTAVLTPGETDELLRLLRGLRAEGYAIVLTTHKLEEALAIGEEFTVLRRGRAVGGGTMAGVTPADLVRLMVGEDEAAKAELSGSHAAWHSTEAAPSVIEARDLEGGEAPGGCPLRGVSFTIRRGEILGIAGVDGNGQQALEAVLAGWHAPRGGRVELEGTDLLRLSPGARLGAGLAIIPSDRHDRGLVLEMSAHENLVLGFHRRAGAPWGKGGPMSRAARAWSRDVVERFGVQPPLPERPMRNFSGGNQQKVVVARALTSEPRFLVASQPARGIDVAAVAAVHARLREARERGMAILLISTELEELLSLSDRVAVMSRGVLTEPLPTPRASRERLGALMAGSTEF